MQTQSERQFRFPYIETERLALRIFEPSDFDVAYRLFNDPDVQKYLSPSNRRTEEQMRATLEKLRVRWLERGFGIWCVCEKIKREIIGYSGFQYFDKTSDAEILFGYFREFWGKGLATEAANACLRYGFEELAFEKVFAATHPENTASQYVLEKLGMNFEDRNRHYQMDSIIYVVERKTFQPKTDFYKLKFDALHAEDDAGAMPLFSLLAGQTHFTECF